jgi:hypothetical protein
MTVLQTTVPLFEPDFFFDGQGGFSAAFILLFVIVLIGGFALRAWGFSRGRQKGYGLIVSASEDPFLLNELPAKPGSEEDLATRKVAPSKKKRTVRPKRKTAPRRKHS